MTVTPQAGFQGLEVFRGAPAKSLRAWVFRDGARLYSLDVFDVSKVTLAGPCKVCQSSFEI